MYRWCYFLSQAGNGSTSAQRLSQRPQGQPDGGSINMGNAEDQIISRALMKMERIILVSDLLFSRFHLQLSVIRMCRDVPQRFFSVTVGRHRLKHNRTYRVLRTLLRFSHFSQMLVDGWMDG